MRVRVRFMVKVMVMVRVRVRLVSLDVQNHFPYYPLDSHTATGTLRMTPGREP